MYYDESTALNFVVQQPSRVWKGYGDGTSRTFTFDGLNVAKIVNVTVGGVSMYGYTTTTGSGGRITAITFNTAPASGSQIRVMYSLGSGRSYNTWSSFGLVPKELPVFASAVPKTVFTEIDGGSTYYDFTEFNNDVPGYKMSTGTFKFMFAEGGGNWNYRIHHSDVINALNGKDAYVSYADQPNWQRRARLSVDGAASDKWSEISIKYDASPYEEYKWSTSENVPWDDLSFEDDPILCWSEDAISAGLVQASNGTYGWQSGWFTWDGPPTILTFEHDAHTHWAFVAWRANPVPDEEGKEFEYGNDAFDYYSGTKTLGPTVFQNSALILRPGQNAIAYTGPSQNSNMCITAREARL